MAGLGPTVVVCCDNKMVAVKKQATMLKMTGTLMRTQ